MNYISSTNFGKGTVSLLLVAPFSSSSILSDLLFMDSLLIIIEAIINLFEDDLVKQESNITFN